MRRFNLHTAELGVDDDDPEGYRSRYARLGPLIGASTMAGTLYELGPGQSNCPLHYESDEEWLIVLEGRPTIRHRDGEDVLAPGDVVCFPAGPDGVHKTTNVTGETVRVLIVSTRNMPAIAVYPDSDKIGVFTEDRRDTIMVRREAGVDYWDREA